MPKAPYPANFQAILDWCDLHRPDLRSTIEASYSNNGIILLLTTGFEAGRKFQHANPDWPLNQPHIYLAEHAQKKT
jgi:hypothetical protein